MKEKVYIRLYRESKTVQPEVRLGDAAEIWSRDRKLEERCRKQVLEQFQEGKEERRAGSVLDVLRILSEAVPEADPVSVGETDFILQYGPPAAPKAGLRNGVKLFFIMLITFAGSAFAIMTFNNDVDVPEIFGILYRYMTGTESDGFTVLEAGYSLGLAAGILLFFNHFSAGSPEEEPTPLEVEMRLYEENVEKAVLEKKGGNRNGSSS